MFPRIVTVQINCFALPVVYRYNSTTIHQSLTAHWFFPLDNKEVIKRSLIKTQVFAQWVTYFSYTVCLMFLLIPMYADKHT